MEINYMIIFFYYYKIIIIFKFNIKIILKNFNFIF